MERYIKKGNHAAHFNVIFHDVSNLDYDKTFYKNELKSPTANKTHINSEENMM